MEMFNKYGNRIDVAISPDALRAGKYTRLERRPCLRCGGAGASDRWAFTGRVCFDCRGSGQGTPAKVTYYTTEAFAKYQAAKAARDARNVAKAQAQAAAFDATPDGQRLIALCQPEGSDAFYHSLLHYGRRHGALSEAQAAALETSIQRAAERATRAAERAAAEAAKPASQHVGAIGERITFEATIERAIPIATQFGTMTITVMADDAGNVYVQKGTSIGERGERFQITATIKAHDQRDGVNQTIINRPRCVRLDADEAAA